MPLSQARSKVSEARRDWPIKARLVSPPPVTCTIISQSGLGSAALPPVRVPAPNEDGVKVMIAPSVRSHRTQKAAPLGTVLSGVSEPW